MLEGLTRVFPDSPLSADDLLCTFSGVRGVIATGKTDPSKELREHALWDEQGLLTVTGGKLTTFQSMALDALRFIRRRLPDKRYKNRPRRVLAPFDTEALTAATLPAAARLRLSGRYGHDVIAFLETASSGELESLHHSPWLWAELRWAARAEAVVHLSDLLLRRVRLGLTLPQGGLSEIDRIRAIAQPELGWDDARWQQEVDDYQRLWSTAYAPRQ